MVWVQVLFVGPVGSPVSRDDLAVGDDLDRIDVPLDRHGGEGETTRHAVTIPVERGRLVLVHLRLLRNTRVETVFGQIQSRSAVAVEANADRFGLTLYDAVAVRFATPQEIGVQFVEVLDLRNGSRPTPLQILDAVLDARLLVPACRHAEQRLEIVVARQCRISLVQLPFTPRENLGGHGRRVVPPDLFGHTTIELEAGPHAMQNRLGPFRRQGNRERAVRIGPHQQQDGNLPASFGKVDVDVPVVDFDSLPRIVIERDERLLLSATGPGDVAPHLIVAALVALLAQSAENLHRRVTLLPRLLLVVFENLVDSRMEFTQLRRAGRFSASIRLRLGLFDCLADLSPRMLELLGDLPHTHSVAISAPNPSIVFHR